MIKTRDKFLKKWRPSHLLSKNSMSVRRFLLLKKTPKAQLYIGGRITKKILSYSSLVLGDKPYQINITLSPLCQFYFYFKKEYQELSKQKNHQRPLLFRQVFECLRPGDHLLIFLKKENIEHSLKYKRIENVDHVFLCSVCKGEKIHSPLKPEILKLWFRFKEHVSKALEARGLSPVHTPSLNPFSATEPHLEVFKTHHHPLATKDQKTKPLYLSTSPEVSLKRLLCRGWTDFYETKKCFRKNEYGPTHRTEFYLLEGYRAYANLNTLIEDLKFLFLFLLERVNKKKSKIKFLKYRMKDLFKKHLNFNLSPSSTSQHFKEKLHQMSIPFSEKNSTSDLFQLLFLNKIGPFLNKENPVIISDYPPFEKAYATIDSRGWAQRFELYWKGMELANAFFEVSEPKVQKNRFLEENALRKALNKPVLAYPKILISEMETGFPPCSGFALGLDRLFLALYDLEDIGQIRFFS